MKRGTLAAIGDKMGEDIDPIAKLENTQDLSKQKTEDRATTDAIERAKLEHAQREQAILRDQQRSRENEGQKKD